MPRNQVCFGSSGGFSGMNRKTIVLKNGMVFVFEAMPGSNGTLRYEKSIPPGTARRMFRLSRRVQYSALKPVDPCNMNSYFEFKRRFYKDQSYSWCINNNPDNPEMIKIQSIINLFP